MDYHWSKMIKNVNLIGQEVNNVVDAFGCEL